jgi:hypothetical protein
MILPAVSQAELGLKKRRRESCRAVRGLPYVTAYRRARRIAKGRNFGRLLIQPPGIRLRENPSAINASGGIYPRHETQYQRFPP